MRAALVGASVGAALVLVTASCVPDWMDSATLTPDGQDSYNVSGDAASGITVSAAGGNAGGNYRLAMWVKGTPATLDQSSCATWTSESGDNVQLGALLRWDGTHGYTVTKNIFGGPLGHDPQGRAFVQFNVHAWDMAKPADQRFTLLGSAALTGLAPGGQMAPLPWRVCAQVTGSALTFQAWPASAPQPVPADPAYSGAATVADTPGVPGWYAGHLTPGQSAHLDSLTSG